MNSIFVPPKDIFKKKTILVDSKLYFEVSWISSDTSCLKSAISNKTQRKKHLKNQEDLNELLMREMRLGIEVHDRWTSDQIAEVTVGTNWTPASQMFIDNESSVRV